MAWTQLDQDDPMVRVRANGQVQWNTATHIMLGNPVSVEMFYDAVTNRLGLRGVYYAGALRALYNENMEYGVDAGAHIDDAGLSFDADWKATPADLAPGDAFPGPRDSNSIAIDVPVQEQTISASSTKRRRSKANG